MFSLYPDSMLSNMFTISRPYVLGLLITLGFVGGYAFYNVVYSVCRTPVKYDIGDIDPRFKLSREEARAAVNDAESIWEDATGKNLFSYTEGSAFKINFIYDDRQETTNEVHTVKDELDEKVAKSDSIREQYSSLRNQYDTLKTAYEKEVSEYETRLKTHNDEVESWNKKGGAPEEIFERLNEEKNDLNDEHTALNKRADTLNSLTRQINALGEKGSSLISDYNEEVQVFNTEYGNGEEFTQGDYEGDKINIYQYESGKELRLVLAHEFGHALSLGHVEDPKSIMYHLMEGQLGETTLSTADLVQFRAVCGTR